MSTRDEVVAAARGWLGTPWKHQARLKGIGVDCVGFIAEVGRATGVLAVEEAANYRRRPHGGVLRASLDRHLTGIQFSAAQPGDVVLLATTDQPDHVGLLGDYPAPGVLSLIHAYLPARKVVEHRLDATWQAKIVAAYRLPGIA